MNQTAYQEITKMLNAFPQSAADIRALLLTYDQALTGVTDQAITEAAQRFTCGDVQGQSRTFAPSIAEFVQEARRVASMLPYRNRPALPRPTDPEHDPGFRRDDRKTRIRMGFKMAVLSASFGVKDGADMVAEANGRGLEDLIALGQRWSVPVPDELWQQIERAA